MVAKQTRIFAKAFLCSEGASPEVLKSLLAGANPSSMVQAAKGTLVRNEAFAELLAAQTLQAEASGSLLANKPEIDFLLRLAGTTQISRAIRDAGVKSGERFVLVVAGRSTIKRPSGFDVEELPRLELTTSELGRIENAALLNARRT